MRRMREKAPNDLRVKHYFENVNLYKKLKQPSDQYRASVLEINDIQNYLMPSFYVKKQVAFMKQKGCAMSYSSFLICDRNDEVNGIVVCPMMHSLAKSKRDNTVGFSTLMYDTDKVGKVFMPVIEKRQDWGLNMSILKKCGTAYGIIEALSYYRKRQDSLSSNKFSLVKYNIAVYQFVLGWSKLKATLWFLFIYVPCWAWKKLVIRLYNR